MVDMTLNALSTEVVKVIHFGTNRFLMPITIAIMLQCCVRRSHLSSSVYTAKYRPIPIVAKRCV